MIRFSGHAWIPRLATAVLVAVTATLAVPSAVSTAAPKAIPVTPLDSAPISLPQKALPQKVLPQKALSQQSRPHKAPPRDPLSDFRYLASDLWAAGPGADTGLVLEYRLYRHGNACTGHGPEVQLRLSGDGRLELIRTRSFAESDRSGPGSFSGRIGKKAWDSVFARVSGMEWETALPGLPMPGMSETNQAIVLRRSGRTALFDFTGPIPPGHDRIAEGLGAVTALMRFAAADTLWSLGLGAAAGKYRNGRLHVRATWSLRGRIPLRIRMPVLGPIDGTPACGILGLRWSQRPKDVQGFTAVPSEKNWAYPKSGGTTKGLGKQPGAEPGAWKDLRPGDSVSIAMDFPLPKPKNAARVAREGNLVHLGFSVAFQEPPEGPAEEPAKQSPVGSADTSADTSAVVTLFTDFFEF